ncbi:unnamed protein product [Aphanomyces euteiches]|uniref:BZIP domain-containing protein n=1 Tax=Aphanomyces euteiches TaxID=100861 RepID=A0A6G0X588_9STRA|nr:hypothetical protein Ae201684_008292 [Aphanomyces euteiches]KAH9070535.1 hypothetical protein Ae201684P_002892 [Aphanomyces euteiches]KAH9135698.1 hypothetical protein AeRB84_018958 [Aphanomyces euteiches]
MKVDCPIDEAKLKKRQYNREKQRLFQARLVNQMVSLKDEVASLEAELRRLKLEPVNGSRSDALPWKEVATGLREETFRALHTNRQLRGKHQEQKELIEMLKAWVNIQTRHGATLSSPSRTWRNVTLLASSRSRSMGYEWITAHLYLNTEAVFQRYAFPSVQSEEISGDFDIDFANPDEIQYIWRYQKEVDLPLELVADSFRDHVWRTMMLGGFVILHTEVLDGMPDQMIYRHTITNPSETVNYLGREYREEGRVVFVGQNIHDDEILPSGSLQRNRMAWVVLERLAPCRTRARILHLNSHYFTKQGYVTMDEEAQLWGCDLSFTPDDKKISVFQQHVSRMGYDVAYICRSKFESACSLGATSYCTSQASSPCIPYGHQPFGRILITESAQMPH